MRYYLTQVGRASSRLLNAVTGGEGDCTFSAWSYELFRNGSRVGYWRVRFVDWLNREPGHCYTSWVWHEAKGLIARDD